MAQAVAMADPERRLPAREAPEPRYAWEDAASPEAVVVERARQEPLQPEPAAPLLRD